jgi:hypothetical protein
VFLCILLTANASTAQKVIEKGRHSFSVYYGLSLEGMIQKVASWNDDRTVRIVGPVGAVYEYMVTDAIGLGAEFGYSSITVTDAVAVNLMNDPSVVDYFVRSEVYRAMLRINYHFSVADKSDLYGFLSAGYRFTEYSYGVNFAGFSGFGYKRQPFPLGLKPGFGYRYFFPGNFGLSLELALGTPIVCGGLNLRF